MDLEVALLIGAAVVGIVVGLLHLVGYVPPRYRRMLSEVQANTATAIADALEARLAPLVGGDDPDAPDPLVALQSGLASLQSAITQVAPQVGVEVTKAIAQAQEEAMKQLESMPPEVTGAIGGTIAQANRKGAELKNAIGQGLLGPYGGLLQQFMPPLYEFLVENPDMVVQALEMPVVQKLIQKGASMMGQVRGTINESGGWG